MAEVVGVVAASGQFIEQSIKIVKLSKALYDKVQDAPSELISWRDKIQELQSLTKKIEEAPALHDADMEASIERCAALSRSLISLFDNLDFKESDSVGLKTWKAIGGLAKEQEIRKLFNEIEEVKSSMTMRMNLVQVNQGHHIISRLDKLELSVQPGSDESKCMQALYCTNPIDDREGIITAKGSRTPKTCEWVTSTKEYQDWDSASSGLLWISGPPGKGKTFLSIYLSQLLENTKPGATVTFFFCDNKISSRNTAVSILRGLMYQLVLQQAHLISCILPTFNIRKEGLFQENSFETLWRLFCNMLEQISNQKIYIILDAMDECEEVSLTGILSKLTGLFPEKDAETTRHPLKLVLLSRDYPPCLQRFLSRFTHIRVDQNENDIKLYIAEKVSHLAVTKGIEDSPLHRHIEKVFIGRSQGTFLWVSFISQDLESKTPDQIEKCLDQLPEGLSAVYERILAQIHPGDEHMVSEMLLWLSLVDIPLRVGELIDAIEVQPTEYLSREEVCMSYIQACGHLLQTLNYNIDHVSEPHGGSGAVTDHNGTAIKDLVVSFVHQSAKDYLVDSSRQNKTRFYVADTDKGRLKITSHLIRYLSRGLRDREKVGFIELDEPVILMYPLLLYARRGWYMQAQQLTDGAFQRLMDDNPSFFAKSSETRELWYGTLHDGRKDSSLLSIACAFGFEYLARQLLRKRNTLGGLKRREMLDKGSPSSFGSTPLHLAIKSGYARIVEILLAKGADPTLVNDSGETAVHVATEHSSHLFAILMKNTRARQLVADHRSDYSGMLSDWPLLPFAIGWGQEDVCFELIENFGYDPLESHDGGQKLLEMAFQAGKLELMRAFVQRWGVRINSPHVLLRTAVKTQDETARKENLRFLMTDLGIPIYEPDQRGNTVLHHATNMSRHRYWGNPYPAITLGLIEFYQSAGGNLGHRNKDGRTFLYGLNRVPMTALLFAHQNGLDINNKDRFGQTVLHYLVLAADLEEKDLIPERLLYAKALLDSGVNRNLEDAEGKSAAERGKQILEILLDPSACLIDPETASGTTSTESTGGPFHGGYLSVHVRKGDPEVTFWAWRRYISDMDKADLDDRQAPTAEYLRLLLHLLETYQTVPINDKGLQSINFSSGDKNEFSRRKHTTFSGWRYPQIDPKLEDDEERISKTLQEVLVS